MIPQSPPPLPPLPSELPAVPLLHLDPVSWVFEPLPDLDIAVTSHDDGDPMMMSTLGIDTTEWDPMSVLSVADTPSTYTVQDQHDLNELCQRVMHEDALYPTTVEEVRRDLLFFSPPSPIWRDGE